MYLSTLTNYKKKNATQSDAEHVCMPGLQSKCQSQSQSKSLPFIPNIRLRQNIKQVNNQQPQH
jgi:hypothetical protein